MQMQEVNLQLVYTLDQWDPFEIGSGNYDTEIADTIQAVHAMDEMEKLARKIQGIYEFSFEQIIPLNQCYEMAGKLLMIKNSGTCTV
jgi:hypothetical protein